MKKITGLLAFALIHASIFVHAQNVNKVEYFFNTDPGFGNGTAIAVTPSTNIADHSFSADISSLPIGMHRLYLRSQRSDGAWSITNSWMFLKAGLTGNVTVNQLEYFFDTDPGFGNGTAVSITPATDIVDFPLNAGIASLGLGLHKLFLRTRSNDGAWSQTSTWLFYKASLAGAGNLTALEYFFDTDPGFGNGTALSIPSSADLADLNFNLDVSLLGGGTHRLYVRSADAAGNWSISNVVEFDRLIPLPVNWLSFTAEPRDRQVYLEWRTDNETDNDHYEAEHSLDGRSYRVIATLPAQSGQGVNVYTHIHREPNANGINYYRIKQVDIDGRFTYSAVRTVDMAETVLVKISPNPASDYIDIKVPERNCTAKLFDMNGRQMKMQLMNDVSERMELTGLAGGSYLLVIEKDGRVMKTVKVVKK